MEFMCKIIRYKIESCQAAANSLCSKELRVTDKVFFRLSSHSKNLYIQIDFTVKTDYIY
jgi:hypothetical protein